MRLWSRVHHVPGGWRWDLPGYAGFAHTHVGAVWALRRAIRRRMRRWQ